MNNNGNRLFFALFSVCILAAWLFAGCGQSRQPLPSATAKAAAATTAVTAASAQQPTPVPTPTPAPTPTPKLIVEIGGMFPGKQPAGLADVFAELNARLGRDISVKLKLSWAPAGSFDASLETALAAGTADFFRCDSGKLAGYAGKGLIAPLDDYMPQYGLALTQNLGAQFFDGMKIGGKLMGVPSASNVLLCGAGHVLAVREDLREKYSLPQLDSIANLELYFKTVKDSEPEVAPLICSGAAVAIMPAFGSEELLGGTGGSVAYKINSDNTVTCEPLQSAAAFKSAAAKLREWFVAGYIPFGTVDAKDGMAQLSSGKAAAAVSGSAAAALDAEAKAASAVPGAQLAGVPVLGSQKYMTSDGGSALCLAAASKSGAEVVQLWNWVYSSQENYDLICYGVEGKNYKLDGDRITVLDDSYKSFPAWIFSNMNFERFPPGVSDETIDTLRHWNDGAAASPLMGFAFDPSAVKAAVAKVQKVYDAYVPALNAGSADTTELLAEFGAMMKAAGQDAVVAEAQKQIDAFLAAAK